MGVPELFQDLVLSLVKAIGRSVWRKVWPNISRPARLACLDDLAEVVEQVEQRRLTELGIQPAEGIVRSWRVIAPFQAQQATGLPDEDVVDYYQRITTGRMLIVGAPGMGKTVTAIQLLLDLLRRRKAHPDAPVPVRFNLSTWNPDTVGFAHWLMSGLVADYSLSPRMAHAVVDNGAILPILDGLDEIDPPQQPTVRVPARAISALQKLGEPPWRGRPLIVTSRSSTVAHIAHANNADQGNSATLVRSVVIELQPLTSPLILARLTRCAEDNGVDLQTWAPLTDRLGCETDPVRLTLANPWLLSLAVTHLIDAGHAGTRALIDAPDQQSIREQLFSDQIPAAVSTLPRNRYGKRRYTETQVYSWLAALSQRFAEASPGHNSGSIRLDGVWELVGNRCRFIHAALAFGMTLTAWAVFACLVYYAEEFRNDPLGPGLTQGIGALAALSLFAAFLSGMPRRTRAHPIVVFTGTGTDRKRWLWAAGVGLIIGGAVSIVFWLISRQSLVESLGDRLLWLCLTGFPVFLSIGLTRKQPPTLDEKRLIRNDFQAACVVTATCWALVMSVIIAANWRKYWHVNPLTLWSVFSAVRNDLILLMIITATLALLLLVGLLDFHYRASFRYLAAVVAFRCTRRFSSRPAQFLDWARRVGLLRVTGAAYQFRHETYERWLTDQTAQSP